MILLINLRDISLVGEDLDPAFKDYRRDIGKIVGIESDAKSLGMYDLPQNYAAEYPKVLDLIARKGLNISGPYQGMSRFQEELQLTLLTV